MKKLKTIDVRPVMPTILNPIEDIEKPIHDAKDCLHEVRRLALFGREDLSPSDLTACLEHLRSLRSTLFIAEGAILHRLNLEIMKCERREREQLT